MARSHSLTRSKGGHNHKINELIKVLSWLGIPEILPSDQGRNFESTVLARVQNAFGLTKSHATAYHPECDGMVEWFNRTLLQLLRSTGSNNCLLFCMLIAHLSTFQQEFLHSWWCMEANSSSTNYQTKQPLNQTTFNSESYKANLQDFVESNLTAADQQKSSYDVHSSLQLLGLEIMSGCLFQQLENWTHDGKGTGPSRLSSLLSMLR